MRAISLWQPWASLWCTPLKVHETRKFPTGFRGWVAVHAARREIEPIVLERAMQWFATEGESYADLRLPLGFVVGLVEVVDCQRVGKGVKPASDADADLSDWRESRYAWRRDRCVLLAQPIRFRGQKGWFDVPDQLVAGFLPPDARP